MIKKYTIFLLFVSLVLSSNAQVVMDGLVGFYPLNGDVNDYSGNDNHGVNMGATAAPDRFNNAQGAYYFDGAGAFIQVAADSANEPDSFVSVSLWVKAEDFTVRQTPLCKRLFHNANPYNSYVVTSTDVGASQKWSFGVSSGTNGSGSGATDPNAMTTTWTHIAGTYDGANVKLYINGALVQTTAKTGLLGYTDSTLRIGLGIPGSSLQYFKGWIDDVRIYGRAITSTEVSTLYSNTTDLLQNPQASTEFGPLFYPNPASNDLKFFNSDITSVKLYSIDGKHIAAPFDGGVLKLTSIPSGIYIVEAATSEGILRRETLTLQH